MAERAVGGTDDALVRVGDPHDRCDRLLAGQRPFERAVAARIPEAIGAPRLGVRALRTHECLPSTPQYGGTVYPVQRSRPPRVRGGAHLGSERAREQRHEIRQGVRRIRWHRDRQPGRVGLHLDGELEEGAAGLLPPGQIDGRFQGLRANRRVARAAPASPVRSAAPVDWARNRRHSSTRAPADSDVSVHAMGIRIRASMASRLRPSRPLVARRPSHQ